MSERRFSRLSRDRRQDPAGPYRLYLALGTGLGVDGWWFVSERVCVVLRETIAYLLTAALVAIFVGYGLWTWRRKVGEFRRRHKWTAAKLPKGWWWR